MDVPGTGPRILESRSTEAGAAATPPFATPLGNVGLMICFDLRFPELALRLRRGPPGADLLTYPSAFSVPTGRAGHWHALLRARAIETQSYVVAAAQCGRHNERRASYGRGLIVGPWGDVKAEIGGGGTVGGGEGDGGGDDGGEGRGVGETDVEIATAEIDLEEVLGVRRGMPLIRRT